MTAAASVGARVRTLRLASGISQTELARAISGGAAEGNAFVSRLEAGRQVVDDVTLTALSDALGCTPDFLSRPMIEAIATRPWLRAYSDAPSKIVDSLVSGNLVAHEVIEVLGLKRVPDGIPVFGGDLSDDHAIERFAEDVRAAASITEGAVVGNVMRAADRLGCVVLPLSEELGRHLGLSQRVDGAPFIRVSRAQSNDGGVPGDRQRFTVAHEIGHLGLHAELPPPSGADESRRLERQAHRFASAFIAPAEPLLDDWHRLGGRVTLSSLADLKAAWGLSIKALVVRFQQLGIIDGDQATSLYKQISKRGWNKAEPVPTTNEQPIWLTKALSKKYGGQVSAATVGRDVGLAARYVDSWIDWSAVTATSQVIDIRNRPRSATSEPRGLTAEVIDLRGPSGRRR